MAVKVNLGKQKLVDGIISSKKIGKESTQRVVSKIVKNRIFKYLEIDVSIRYNIVNDQLDISMVDFNKKQVIKRVLGKYTNEEFLGDFFKMAQGMFFTRISDKEAIWMYKLKHSIAAHYTDFGKLDGVAKNLILIKAYDNAKKDNASSEDEFAMHLFNQLAENNLINELHYEDKVYHKVFDKRVDNHTLFVIYGESGKKIRKTINAPDLWRIVTTSDVFTDFDKYKENEFA